MRDESEDLRRVGRDEMNLCEFPIALLTDYPSEGVKTMVFEDRHGRLTVSGSDAYGLPTAPDSDVIVGLIQLTKLRNDFTCPTVEFTRYELLKLLGWEDKGRNYRRLTESLRRWVGVTLYCDFRATGAACVDPFSTVFPGMVGGRVPHFQVWFYRISRYGLGVEYRISRYGLPHFQVWFEVASGPIIGLAASLPLRTHREKN